jgi:8-amino-7-oxononanoate synthase
MVQIDTLPGRTVLIENQEFLYFSGTSYLGMARNAEFQSYVQEGFARYGTNFSNSRISNVQLAVFDEAENYLAAHTGAGAALTLSSGFLAGQLVVRQLQLEGRFVYAPQTHPALWLENEIAVTEHHHADWVRNLPSVLESISEPHVVLLSNSLDPLYVEKYDFSWVAQLPDNKHFTIVIDDSHGLGVIGKDGGGIFGQIPTPPHVELIVTSSLGKALGLPGGVILSGRKRIEQFKKSPFFTTGSPMSPAYLHAFLRAEKLYAILRQRLFQNSIFFKAQTPASQLFRSFDNYPVFHTDSNELYEYMRRNHILISSFPYPSARHPSITRLVVSALHTDEDMNEVIKKVNAFG